MCWKVKFAWKKRMNILKPGEGDERPNFFYKRGVNLRKGAYIESLWSKSSDVRDLAHQIPERYGGKLLVENNSLVEDTRKP